MKTKQTLAVFIGRFQPFHLGHLDVVERALGVADSILLLVGSSYRPRSWKNPFTYNERRDFIAAGTRGVTKPVATLPLVDTLYNDRAWITNVRTAVTAHMRRKGLDPATTKIVLTGFEKDKSSQYLNWFPTWDMLDASPKMHDGVVLNATDLRENLFFGEDGQFGRLSNRFGDQQIAPVVAWMKDNPDAMTTIRDEGAFVRDYKERTKAAEQVYGYPIPINTADAVVVQSGHVLLIERSMQPGKGLWAIPGGHIDPGETALDAAIRELYEEAGLDMPKGAMRGRLRERRVFDHPERSEKGWVRTEAFVFELQDRAKLEKVKSDSDAASAKWVPITEITPDTLFEDHFDIIHALVPEVPFAYSSILMAQG
ncbi:bifunctional NMN adenylyltransferase/nudix hydrolase [Yoonia maritima]|uniref:Bifunctional NMN adenylyltransferase/nudix hydrolase n=1 Tax=Yoonia maritima TaxID=1435347 RepID=A0A2T0VX64_9RHOB|nr:NUDIX domain-containing protein [Yoonia maritima]PRY76624.1 bifunctional NMN adenylyltransferase/nudix hydrolase [Yoonia maritima]